MQVRNFSKIGDAIEAPDLAELQVAAYRRFLQPDLLPHERKPVGLEGVFREVFPIVGEEGALRMEYLGYELGQPVRTEEECRHLGLSYCHPLRVRLRTVGAESVEEDVYLADVPKMIGSGEFVINGSDRVVVSQIQRSAGVDFSEVVGEDGRSVHSCRFIPERGTWVEFMVGRRDVLQVRLGQSGRMPATWLLRAMLREAASDAEILALFYEPETVQLSGAKGRDAASGIEGRYLAGELVNPDTGELIARAGSRIAPELAEALAVSGMKEIAVLKNVEDKLILNTLESDPCKGYAEAVLRIYARFRPGEPASLERAAEFFAGRFADPASYSLGRVGRFRVNQKFQHGIPEDRLTLCPEDILCAIRYLVKLRRREGATDDIDDLGNRVLKGIDKLLELPLREACMRWRRSIREQLMLDQGKTPTPSSIAGGTRALAGAFEDFFGRGELSQVVDQTNPLAELNHVRRISALGPGGLNRKRAGFEVRDVHASHYGRICPIETPEGQNIGLIASLGTFARVDEYGFITTPFRTWGDGSEIRYLRADEERDVLIAPAGSEKLAPRQKIVARARGEFREARNAEEIRLEDVSPRQMVGVSASLIPFLEHNDANRALMGSNMQRQAVPLQQTERALVVTGMEGAVARSSGMVVVAEKEGVVTEVDGAHIQVGDERYPLRKYARLSESTCLNQRPIVREGDRVSAGQAIADGAATRDGELSLGRNVLAAFMIWDGYNFEDAIIVSENLIKADKYTSIHIEEFTAELRETRLGHEEFTRDIPNVSERALANLDAEGIVCVGTHVEPGDILVGKVVPKTKAELTPEEKLLREIFGKAGIDVANESLTVPPGVGGVVVQVHHYRRKTSRAGGGTDADRRDSLREAQKAAAEYDARTAEAFTTMVRELSALASAAGGRLEVPPKHATVREVLHQEQCFRFDADLFSPEAREQASRVYFNHRRDINRLKAERDHEVRKLRSGDELPNGVLEMVKIFVAVKRPLSAGDKMAGRHGNKGVIARVVPQEDMPFLPDGTPIEIILNPLGVPSRMNVGQILETHLGWAGRALGFRAVSPVFDGATESEIRACLREAGLPDDGKTQLCDGRTGEPFDQKVTVGYIYIMKLNHLVDEKIHARATGPYSMVTQQPLGGKARMGGQRLGEMEVWALEAYGAAYLLQEMMTVKSDDVEGRVMMYEAIIKGRNVLEAGTPVSFDVLVQEVRGLGMNLRLDKGPRIEDRGPRRSPSVLHPSSE